MTALLDTASLAESTVIDAAKHVTKGRRVRRRDLNGAVEHRVIDERVARKALELAAGDISRLRVQADGSILVVNQSRREWS